MPHIIGEKVYLREYRIEDVEAVQAWRNTEAITWYAGVYVWPESLEQTRRFVQAQIDNVDPANRKFAICLRSDDSYVGHIGYELLDLRRRNTELGIMLARPDLLSQGIGTEALQLFLKVCFEELGLHRVGLRVYRENPRGMRAYAKCGFQEEGVIRDFHFSRGRWHDLVFMSILEDEYWSRQGAGDSPQDTP